MRILTQGRVARAIAQVLTLVFLWPAAFLGAAAVPADAQIVTRTAATQSVGVVPFENLSRHRQDTLGDEASDAVAVELRDRLLLDVLPRADVSLQMRDLGITAPVSDVEMVRLAAEMEVTLLITGQIRGARVARGPDGRYGEVMLAVRLFDRVARADVNGALVAGRSPGSVESSDDTLLAKALEQAAFQAVEQMRSRPTITAMVLWTRGDVAFLNVGDRGGLQAGIELVVIRSGERIGMVEVTESDPLGSYCQVTQGPPLRPGDNLRAIYRLPSAVGGLEPGQVSRQRGRVESVLWPALILLGLGGLPGAARAVEGPLSAFGAILASAITNAASLTYPGTPDLVDPDDDTIIIFPERPVSWASLVTWMKIRNSESARVIYYELWRGGTFLDVVDAGWEAEYVDMSLMRGNLDITLTVIPETGHYALTEWLFEGVEDLGTDLQDNEITVSEVEVTYAWAHDYNLGGFTTQYLIIPVVLVKNWISEGVYEWGIQRSAASSSGGVTLLVPALTFPFHLVNEGISPYEDWVPYMNPDVVGNMATFWFYAPDGANEVVIEIARDPNYLFPPSATYSQAMTGVMDGGWNTFLQSVQVDLTNVSGTSQTFTWRIGGTNRYDPVQPRPWPSGNPQDFGHVWSRVNNFTLPAP
ncbi:MAG: hypothetical protein IMF16_04770, partial [Proteobacteria bacterium]|nr:hypothetical protein [Pseudomonadota bacterium]